MTKRTLLFLDQYGSMGGGQRILLSLAEAARNEGWRVEALLPPGPCTSALRALGVEVHQSTACHLREGRKGVRDVAAMLWHALRVLVGHLGLLRRTDMLYANGGHMYLPCFFASTLFRKPAVYHLHLNPSMGHIRLLRLFLRSSLTRRIVVVSPFVARVLREANAAFDDPRVEIVENGLDERFTCLKFADRFSETPLRHVGILGRVCMEKGQDVLLPLAKALPDMQFHILGDSAFYGQEYLEGLARHAPVNVHFHGWVEDVPAKVESIGLQLCLVPSRCPPGEQSRLFEGSSLVLMQVMALSCLVVPRRLGVLADMAQQFGIRYFEKDAELLALLQALMNSKGSVLASEAYKNFMTIMQSYSHEVFQGRLSEMFRVLERDLK